VGRKLLVVTAPLWRIKIKANLSFQTLLDRSDRHSATFWPYQFLKLSLSAEAERPQAFVTQDNKNKKTINSPIGRH
jgi:hypothetical protein